MPQSMFDEIILSLRQVVNPFLLLAIMFVAGIVLSNKIRKTLQGKLMLFILTVFWFMSFNSMLMSFSLRDVFIWLLFTYFPLPLFIAPLSYFYVRSLVIEHYRVSRKEWLHLIVPILIFLISLLINAALVFAELQGNESAASLSLDLFISVQGFSLFYVLLLQMIVYAWLCIRLLRGHAKHVEHFFSYSEGVSLHWVRFFVAGMLLFFIIFLMSNNELLFIPGVSDSVYDVSNFVITLLFIFIIGAHGIGQQNVYEQSQRELLAEHEVSNEKPTFSLDEVRKKDMAEKIAGLLENEKLYLNPSLTLDLLAVRIGSNRTYASLVINEMFGMSFYSLVNKYRVEEAIRRLQDDKHNKYSVEGIAGMCGFASRSSFNLAFRKQTGKTPSDFRSIR